MKNFLRLNFAVLLLVCLSFVLPSVSLADDDDEWIEVPVVVNILTGTNFTEAEIDGMIDKINDILKPAKIKLVVKAKNSNVSVGNGDGNLDLPERREARRTGRQELDSTCGQGRKGIKITMANQPCAESPDYVGWALHRSRVVFVKPDPQNDPNYTAAAAAHEIVHDLTVNSPNNGHSLDPNDLMYWIVNNQNELRPSDVNEIRPVARQRALCYTIEPGSSGEKSSSNGDGKIQKCNAGGGLSDPFSDVYVTSGDPALFDPLDPAFGYADIEDVVLFCDEPYAENASVQIEIIPGGVFPEVEMFDSFFDVYIDYNPAVPAADRIIQVHLWRDLLGGPLQIKAEFLQADGLPISPIAEVLLHNNEYLDMGEPLIVGNLSIELNVPLETGPTGSFETGLTDPFETGLLDPFDVDITIIVESRVEMDPRLPGITLKDETAPFSFAMDSPLGRGSIALLPVLSSKQPKAFWVCGTGFEAFDEITVRQHYLQHDYDGIEVLAVADAQGAFKVKIDPPYAELGTFMLTATGTVPVDNNITQATGYFSDAPLKADFNLDGSVTLSDLAVFASQWLSSYSL